jgi:polysaccharide export outer membrane protein
MAGCRILVRFVTLFVLGAMTSFGQTQREPIVPIAQGIGSSSNAATAAGGSGTVSGLSDDPISAGQVVHISVFNAPDFTFVTRVSENGEIAVPFLGAIHIEGQSSMQAGSLLASQLMSHNLLIDPEVTVTVESNASGVTVLGEVHSPGIFPLPGKHSLSDVLAVAGGLTSNTGRVIEIANNRTPEKKEYIPWDPTMHNTSSFDRLVNPGDRVLVRACGIAYVGGNVGKPGAYSLCGSREITLSELISLAGGMLPLTAPNHTVIVRPLPDATRMTFEVDAKKILEAKAADIVVHEDDVIYIPASGVKNVANRALGYSLSLVSPLLFYFH